MYNDFLKRNAAVAISGLMALSLAAVLSFAGIACATTCSQPCCKQNALANNGANQPTDKEATACSQPCCKTQLLLAKHAADEQLQQEIETAVTFEATACSQPCCKTQFLLTRIRKLLDTDKGSEDRSPPVLDIQIGGDYHV